MLCCAVLLSALLSSDLPRPVASVDVPRHYETPQSIDSDTGAFRLTKFRRSAAVGLVHLTKVSRRMLYQLLNTCSNVISMVYCE